MAEVQEKEFTVTIREVHVRYVQIRAVDEEQAVRKVKDGQGESGGTEWERDLPDGYSVQESEGQDDGADEEL